MHEIELHIAQELRAAEGVLAGPGDRRGARAGARVDREELQVPISVMVDHQQDVLAPLPQRRKRDGKDVQAIEEVLAQLSRGHGLVGPAEVHEQPAEAQASTARWKAGQPLGPLDGVVGVQWESGRFKADGEEAFVPYSRSRSQALFALEEWRTGWGQLQAGARIEQVAVRSEGSPWSERFVAGERRFDPRSASLCGYVQLAGDWRATAQLAHSERAPSDAELFANGPHLATHTWETGNASLGLEKSNSIELGLERRNGPHPMKFSVYDSRFSNFIGLMAVPDAFKGDNALPEYAYAGVRARLRGWEASGQSRVWQSAGTVDLHWRADQVLADNLSTGQPLPRIAPWRVGLSGVYRFDAWQARLGFDHAAAQRRVPTGSEPTAAYTLWHASLNYRQTVDVGTVHWFARLDNITNALAYSATSILTSTAPGRVPLPGRSLKLGLQWQF